ncbi:MAG: hypothetical protein QOG23_4065 [Blastocatellia bacterium]|nr:hypothetical protein [Blastocatellia bacterium]
MAKEKDQNTNARDQELAKAKWLVMVYLAGDNNLSSNSIAILQELEAVTHDPNVKVLACFDTSTPWPKGARYVEINRHSYSSPNPKMEWPLHNDLVQPGHIVVTPDFCGTLSHPPKPTEPIAEEGLARFLGWARETYRADNYMLILFGHGTIVAGNTFLSDTTPPSYLRLTDLSRILKEHFRHKIDILAFDNCVMNGIETAVQLRDQVDYMLGSQGLVLTVGWPYRKIINEIVANYPKCSSKELALRVLSVCARNLLDFSLMERSSEQAVIDLTKFGRHDQLVPAVRDLSAKLQQGLAFHRDKKTQKIKLSFPIIRDTVRLARLEAQSYWGETFVDLYDFCELLLKKCTDFMCALNEMNESLRILTVVAEDGTEIPFRSYFKEWPSYQQLERIAICSRNIVEIFREAEIVPRAYYVCPELQYSHGISIYFPWTLAQDPTTFEPIYDQPTSGRCDHKPTNYTLKTPFEEYEEYAFAKRNEGDWACFLDAFFRATLRNVRVVEYEYPTEGNVAFFKRRPRLSHERDAPVTDLQKSTSSTGDEGQGDCPQIKNYPRRFYLSPADCDRRMQVWGMPGSVKGGHRELIAKPGEVSYLGWNVRGLVAEVICLPESDGQEPPLDPECDN